MSADPQTSMPFRDDARDEAFELNRTPPAVVDQLFRELATWMEPGRILDPAAGDGVFGQFARKHFPHAVLWGVEPREEEESASRFYDRWNTCTAERYLEQTGSLFDLIVTNPPFSRALEWVHLMVPRLTDLGVLVFIQLNDFGQRSKVGYELFSHNPPCMQLRIPGCISFRGGTCDARSYSWWVFDRMIVPPIEGMSRTWLVTQLPRLSAAERRHA